MILEKRHEKRIHSIKKINAASTGTESFRIVTPSIGTSHSESFDNSDCLVHPKGHSVTFISKRSNDHIKLIRLVNYFHVIQYGRTNISF